MPATGSKKIDTVAAELVPRKRRAASVSNSRRRILRKFRTTTLGGVRRGGAWALGVNPSEQIEGTSNVHRLEAVRVPFRLPLAARAWHPAGQPLNVASMSCRL
jgi:hypothetical protein